jgi:hypothetical protein
MPAGSAAGTAGCSPFSSPFARLLSPGRSPSTPPVCRGGVQSLIRLASAVPERAEARREIARAAFLARIGTGSLLLTRSAQGAVAFIGEATLSLLRLFTGHAQFRRGDLVLIIQQVGAEALPIVALISVLVGLILAFVGSIQLQMLVPRFTSPTSSPSA